MSLGCASERAQRAFFVDENFCTRNSSESTLKSRNYDNCYYVHNRNFGLVLIGQSSESEKRVCEVLETLNLPREMIPTSAYNLNIRVRATRTPVTGTVTVLLPVGACQWQCGT